MPEGQCQAVGGLPGLQAPSMASRDLWVSKRVLCLAALSFELDNWVSHSGLKALGLLPQISTKAFLCWVPSLPHPAVWFLLIQSWVWVSVSTAGVEQQQALAKVLWGAEKSQTITLQ